MQGRVKLPSGPLIDYLKFCRVIAEAICPIDKNPKGIKCIWAKIHPGVPNVGQELTFPLNDIDRQALAKALEKLPSLRYPMSKEEIASFNEAYVSLPNSPMWMPVFVTKETILGQKIERDRVMDLHLKAIRKERRAGRLVPVNTSYVAVDAVELGACLTRKDAIAYLERHGLVYDDEEKTKSAEQDALWRKADQTQDVDQLALSDRTKVGAKKISDAEKAEAVKLHAKLKAKDEKCTKLIAKKYGVSESLVRRWVREDKRMKEKKPSVENYFFSQKRENLIPPKL